MAKILIVIPPLPERSYPGKFMGPDYLASALVESGHEVKILDLDLDEFENQEKESLIQKISIYDPLVIGITNLSIQADIANYFAYLIKQHFPEKFIVKGGIHETVGYRWTLELHHDYVDACAVGYAEEAFCECVEFIEKGTWKKNKRRIKNFAYWENGEVCFNGFDHNSKNYIPLRLNYSDEYNFSVFDFTKTAQVMTMRGCAFSCNFCSESFLRDNYLEKFRILEKLEDELKQLKKEGYRSIYFDDSSFTINRQRTLEICALVDKYGFDWGCNTRVDIIDEDIIRTMVESGCKYIFCGVESFVPEILLALNKTKKPEVYIQDAKRVYKIFNKLHKHNPKHNLLDNVFLIFGNLRKNGDDFGIETQEDIDHSLTEAIDLETDFISLNIMRLLPEVPFSYDEKFSKMRANGEKIHAGFYDSKWYIINQREDIRSSHPVFRCFEGASSVNPIYATPMYAYNILKKAVELINHHNVNRDKQIRLIVDKSVKCCEKGLNCENSKVICEMNNNNKISYMLKNFDKIRMKKKHYLIQEWIQILKNL